MLSLRCIDDDCGKCCRRENVVDAACCRQRRQFVYVLKIILQRRLFPSCCRGPPLSCCRRTLRCRCMGGALVLRSRLPSQPNQPPKSPPQKPISVFLLRFLPCRFCCALRGNPACVFFSAFSLVTMVYAGHQSPCVPHSGRVDPLLSFFLRQAVQSPSVRTSEDRQGLERQPLLVNIFASFSVAGLWQSP